MLLTVLLFLGAEDVLLIALVILLLFGGKKIPELMKSMGKGVKSFKDAMDGLDKDITTHKTPAPPEEPDKNKPSGTQVG
jgi:sec-independent protein translocase protein TatA